MLLYCKVTLQSTIKGFLQLATKVYGVWLRGLSNEPWVDRAGLRFPRTRLANIFHINCRCILCVHWEGRLSPSLTRSTWLIQRGSNPDIVLSKSYWFWVQHKRLFNPTKKRRLYLLLDQDYALKANFLKIKENSVHELLAFLTVQEAEESQSRSCFSSLFLFFLLKKRWCLL